MNPTKRLLGSLALATQPSGSRILFPSVPTLSLILRHHSLSPVYHLWTNTNEPPIHLTSSTGHTMSSHSNFQLIINALGDYANQTGIDLSQDPFAEKVQHLNTPDAILELLQEREKAFKEYRDGNRRLLSCLSPAVRVLHAISNVLGGAVSCCSVPFSLFCTNVFI